MEQSKPNLKGAEKSGIAKSIWDATASRFGAMMDIFGPDEMAKELCENPMWNDHLFKSAKPVEKFASNFQDNGMNSGENKETWNGARYENIAPGEREFITEVETNLKKAQIVFKDNVGDIKGNEDQYIAYIKKSADAIIKALRIKKGDDLFSTSGDVHRNFHGNYDVNGHRHKQHNGGLTGTDIPVPGIDDWHFHIMEGGNGATWSNDNSVGHTHEDPNDNQTGGPIWPEYSCKEKVNQVDISKGLTNIQDFIAKSRMNVMKLNAPKQIVIGALYIPFDENNPETVDTHGHACTKEEIECAAYEFMKQRNLGNVDLQHNFEKGYGYVVESYIAKDGDPDFIPGTWVVGVKVTDDTVWAQVEKGEIAGFSLAGAAYLREVA